MNTKRILAVLLLLVMVVGLAACGVGAEDVVGVWKREPLYMAYYGCETEMIVSFAEDGSYVAMLLNHENNAPLNYAGGTWSLKGSTIVAEKDDGSGNMEYAYDKSTDTVEFEGYTFTRSE